ncbi:lipoate--protein ligase family protein [Candidatus Woesearchaeota archaeon]|nr:lipoate--protein ligase family protein [Candidatus Woesearchaeota archaeon]
MQVRLLKTGSNTAFMNMAIDESVLAHVSKGLSIPTLRFYGWKPAAVSIGYFQSMEDEVDVELCKEKGIDCTRRVTGGGAVFHDKEVTYSLIIPENSFVSNDILESYKQICGGIISGLQLFGIKSEFKPLNDIIAYGKKISGNAQTRRLGCILQHGTIIQSVDVKRMFSILKVPDEKIKDKLIKSVEERVTSVNNILGKEVSFEKIGECLIKGFSSALNLELVEGKLSSSEIGLAERLVKEKYETKEWNFKR